MKGSNGLGRPLLVASVLALLAPGCGAGSSDEANRSGFMLQMLMPEYPTDVTDIQYTIQPVSFEAGTPTGAPVVIRTPLEPPTIPGTPSLTKGPLDPYQARLLGDFFEALPAGNYDVTALPFAGDSPSRECTAVSMERISVTEGQTTEVFLISQCLVSDTETVDTGVGLNREPVIENVSFRESKNGCGSPAELCVRAVDADDDPLELVLEAPQCQVASADASAPNTQCWEVSCAEAGRTELIVRAYDLRWLDELVRIEDYLAAEGLPEQSHAELMLFPFFDQPTTTGPGATERCDGVDNDCNGVIDDSDACEASEIVVFNDANPFDFFRMQNPDNQALVENLIKFRSGKLRDAGTVVLMDRGRGSVCGNTDWGACSPSKQTSLYSLIKDAGYTIEDIYSKAGTLVDIPPEVKILFLWNPTVPYTLQEVNAFKTFTAQGGRLIFVGEYEDYYGEDGLSVENALLYNMGSSMRNIGGEVCEFFFSLSERSLRAHQITRGLRGLGVACASVLAPGPKDSPLLYDAANTRVLAAVAAIDRTPITTLATAPVLITPSHDRAIAEGP